MNTDPDFSKVQLKVNASGRWWIVSIFKVDDLDRVKVACKALSECAQAVVNFKLLDAEGGELETLSYKINGGYAWRKPT